MAPTKLTFRVSKEMDHAIRELADLLDMSLSEILRALIQIGLDLTDAMKNAHGHMPRRNALCSLTLNVSKELYREVLEIANRLDATPSEVVRVLVRIGLTHWKPTLL